MFSKCKMYVVLFLSATLVLSPVVKAEARYVSEKRSLTGVNEILVKYKDKASEKDLLEKYGDIILKKNSRLGIVKIKPEERKDLKKLLADLKEDPAVEFAEPNYQYQLMEIPNDPYFPQQWSLPIMMVPQAWEATQGRSSIIVAVVDSGVDLNHPEFAGRLASGFRAEDSIRQEGTTVAQDNNGHGTHVAGIIAAEINNGTGIAGIAGDVKIMPVKVMDATGSGYVSDIADGICWAAEHGADVINLSLGGESSQTLTEAIEYAHDLGAIIVASAGNDGDEDVLYPAASPHVIGVGATDSNDEIFVYSNWGDGIDISAPGVNIYSTLWENGASGYGYKSGTSMAAPHISGVAALVLSLYPELTNDQVEEVIELAADDLGENNWDSYFGYGRINALSPLDGDLPIFDDDEDNSIDNARPLAIESVGGGTICPIDDEDWFSVNIVGGMKLNVEIIPPQAMDGIVEIYNSASSQIATVDFHGCGEADSLVVTFPDSGEYYLRIYDFNSRWSTDSYSLIVNRVINCDLNGDGSINMMDLQVLSAMYGTNSTNNNWNQSYDLVQDGIIDLYDLVALSKKIV